MKKESSREGRGAGGIDARSEAEAVQHLWDEGLGKKEIHLVKGNPGQMPGMKKIEGTLLKKRSVLEGVFRDNAV